MKTIPTTTVESTVVKPAGLTAVPQAPGLCAGDHLTRAEFERRYSAMPNFKKAELIEGAITSNIQALDPTRA